MTHQIMDKDVAAEDVSLPGVVDLIVAELREHEPLLNQLRFPGTVHLHLNPFSETCPVKIQIDYKLPSQQDSE